MLGHLMDNLQFNVFTFFIILAVNETWTLQVRALLHSLQDCCTCLTRPRTTAEDTEVTSSVFSLGIWGCSKLGGVYVLQLKCLHIACNLQACSSIP